MEQIFYSDDHGIDLSEISINALKVVRRLGEAGYRAFLVGGSVRDLILGEHPKDFDVATDAHPEEVKDLFRNSRMVGRRFRIVHVRFGREIIEVATFRAHHDKDSHDSFHGHSGLILSDNVYGSFDEDVQRRDFTINSLYYQPEEQAVYDHAGGMPDIRGRKIRLIGDPEKRYREDPVRMLRAVRFAARLDFDISPETATPIRNLAVLLRGISPARLFDEVLKLLMTGHGERTFHLMRDFNLLESLFPATSRALKEGGAEELILSALRSTDRRIRNSQPVTPFFLFAALLWPSLQQRTRALRDKGMSPLAALQEAARNILADQQQFTAVPRRVSAPMKEVWELQQRLVRRQGKRTAGLLSHKRFRAAYDFLLLREETGESLDDVGDWWTRYQEEDQEGRETMARELPNAKPQRRRKRRSKRSKSS